MTAQISPQPVAVGEFLKPESTSSVEGVKPSYASIFQANQTASSKIELCPVNFESEHPVIQFSMEDVNIFTREEGLHQAVVINFSYGKPDVSEVRRIFSSQFDIKGHCNVGQLEYRHLLVRFDLFDDYARFLGKSTEYLKSKSEEFFFRTFPWTFGFNPKEETPMAVVWISMPGLPQNLFARRSLMTIAFAVGKPIAVDKATQDKTRPSAARVKVILNLLDNHSKKVLLQFSNSKSGKTVEFHQIIVYNILPSYCNFSKHQGHVEKACRYKDASNDNKLASNASDHTIEKLKGDARDFLNGKRAAQTKIVNNNQQANLVWKQKAEQKNVQSTRTESLSVDPILKEGNKTVTVSVSEDERNVSNLEDDATVNLNANNVYCSPKVQHVGQSKALHSANKDGKYTVNLKDNAEKEFADLTVADVLVSCKKIQDNASVKFAQQILVDSGDLDEAADRDIADLSEDKEKQNVEDCEDSSERPATAPLTAAVNADCDQFGTVTVNGLTDEDSQMILIQDDMKKAFVSSKILDKDRGDMDQFDRVVDLLDIAVHTASMLESSEVLHRQNTLNDQSSQLSASDSLNPMDVTVSSTVKLTKIDNPAPTFLRDEFLAGQQHQIVSKDQINRLPTTNKKSRMFSSGQCLETQTQNVRIVNVYGGSHSTDIRTAIQSATDQIATLNNEPVGKENSGPFLKNNISASTVALNLAAGNNQGSMTQKGDVSISDAAVQERSIIETMKLNSKVLSSLPNGALDTISEASPSPISASMRKSSVSFVNETLTQAAAEFAIADSPKIGKEFSDQTEDDQLGNEAGRLQFSQATQTFKDAGEINEKENWTSISNKNRKPVSKTQQQSELKDTNVPTDHNSFAALVNTNDENENQPVTKDGRAESQLDNLEAVERNKGLTPSTNAAIEDALQQQKEDEERYRLKGKAVAPYIPSSQKTKNYFLRNIANSEPRQSERNWDREGVNIRTLPMRKAKQEQVDKKSKNKK